MAPVSELVAHGGVAGALAEALIALAVILVLGAVWMRERRTGEDDVEREGLSDDESSAS